MAGGKGSPDERPQPSIAASPATTPSAPASPAPTPSAAASTAPPAPAGSPATTPSAPASPAPTPSAAASTAPPAPAGSPARPGGSGGSGGPGPPRASLPQARGQPARQISAARRARQRRVFLLAGCVMSSLVLLFSAVAWGLASYANGAVGRIFAGAAGGSRGPLHRPRAGAAPATGR